MNHKDAAILQELELNAKIPIKQLAKKVRLNEDTVHYRIKRLQEKEILLGTYAVIDYHKLEYITYRFMFKLQHANSSILTDILVKLNRISGVFYSLAVSGNYDIIYGIRSKSISGIFDIHNQALKIYESWLYKESMDILVEVGHYPRILTSVSNRENYCLKLTKANVYEKLDSLDTNLLNFLSQDARVSSVVIANALNIPVRTVLHRLRKLEKSKIIQGYKPLIDYTKLGKSFHKLFLHITNHSLLTQIIAFSITNPCVTYYEIPLGNSNLEIDIEVSSEVELRTFTDSLINTFSEIKLIERISLDTYSKLTYFD